MLVVLNASMNIRHQTRSMLAVLVCALVAILWPAPATASVRASADSRLSFSAKIVEYTHRQTLAEPRLASRSYGVSYDFASDPLLRWKGRWHYNFGGTEVYDIRARQWCPELAAFLSIDDLNFHDRRSTLWGWPGQNPIRYRDPSGHYAGPIAGAAYEVAAFIAANPVLIPVAIAVVAAGVIAADLYAFHHPTINSAAASCPIGGGGGAAPPGGPTMQGVPDAGGDAGRSPTVLFRAPQQGQLAQVASTRGFVPGSYPSPGLFVTTQGSYAAEYAQVYQGGLYEITVSEATMTQLRQGGHIVIDADPLAASRGSFSIKPSGLPLLNQGATIRHIPHGSQELWIRFGVSP